MLYALFCTIEHVISNELFTGYPSQEYAVSMITDYDTTVTNYPSTE
jgi:hypothetical protein